MIHKCTFVRAAIVLFCGKLSKRRAIRHVSLSRNERCFLFLCVFPLVFFIFILVQGAIRGDTSLESGSLERKTKTKRAERLLRCILISQVLPDHLPIWLSAVAPLRRPKNIPTRITRAPFRVCLEAFVSSRSRRRHHSHHSCHRHRKPDIAQAQ